MYWVLWLSALLTLAALALWLTSHWGSVGGLAAYGVIAVLMTVVAGGLLHRSEVGRVTWKNRVAGLLLPWSMWVGGGSLPALLFKNFIGTVLFGIGIAFWDPWHDHSTRPESETSIPGTDLGWLDWPVALATICCWIVLLGAWVRLLQSAKKEPTESWFQVMSRNHAWQPLVIPPVVVGLSVGLHYSGRPWFALITAGLPLMVVLFPVGLMLAGLLIQYLTGKPTRWN